MAVDLPPPVVLDNGTGFIKAGFAGLESPHTVFPTVVGTPSALAKQMGKAISTPRGGAGDSTDVVLGHDAVAQRGLVQLRHPVDAGRVRTDSDWDDLELLWRHAYSHLGVSPKRQPLLVSEAPLNGPTHRHRMAALAFEELEVPSLYVASQPVLSLYASKRTTGVVVDIGDGVSCAVPVYDGAVVRHGIQRLDVAGRAVTTRLASLLNSRGHSFLSSAEVEIVREMKDHVAYVAPDYAAEVELANPAHEHHATKFRTKAFELPDGTEIVLGAERFECAEVLFQPQMVGMEDAAARTMPRPGAASPSATVSSVDLARPRGLHGMVMDAIGACGVDARRALAANVVLGGGTTMLPGLRDRLLLELASLASVRKEEAACVRDMVDEATKAARLQAARYHPTPIPFGVHAATNRHFSAWVGGSILASLSSFQPLWVMRADFDEYGPSVLDMADR